MRKRIYSVLATECAPSADTNARTNEMKKTYLIIFALIVVIAVGGFNYNRGQTYLINQYFVSSDLDSNTDTLTDILVSRIDTVIDSVLTAQGNYGYDTTYIQYGDTINLDDTLLLSTPVNYDSLITNSPYAGFFVDTAIDTSAGAGKDTVIVTYWTADTLVDSLEIVSWKMGSLGLVDTLTFGLEDNHTFDDCYDNDGNLMLLNSSTKWALYFTPNDTANDSMKVAIAMAVKQRGYLGTWTSVVLFADSMKTNDSLFIDTSTTALRTAMNLADSVRFIITITDRGLESLLVRLGALYGE